MPWPWSLTIRVLLLTIGTYRNLFHSVELRQSHFFELALKEKVFVNKRFWYYFLTLFVLFPCLLEITTTVVQSDCPVEKSRWDGTHKNKRYYPSDDPSGLSGYIHSPDFHGKIQYETLQDCWWHIHAPVGNVIKLTFLDFRIQKPRYSGSGCRWVKR